MTQNPNQRGRKKGRGVETVCSARSFSTSKARNAAAVDTAPVQDDHDFNLLIDKHFETVPMDRDGNCFFRGLAFHIYGDADRHQEVRKDICKFMKTNQGIFEQFLVSARFSTYLNKMKRMGIYGGNHEALAGACMYSRYIFIFDSLYSSEKPVVIPGINEGDRAFINSDVLEQMDEEDPILLIRKDEHYDVLLEKDATDSLSAALKSPSISSPQLSNSDSLSAEEMKVTDDIPNEVEIQVSPSSSHNSPPPQGLDPPDETAHPSSLERIKNRMSSFINRTEDSDLELNERAKKSHILSESPKSHSKRAAATSASRHSSRKKDSTQSSNKAMLSVLGSKTKGANLLSTFNANATISENTKEATPKRRRPKRTDAHPVGKYKE